MANVIGKLYPKDEADKLFGNVLESIELKKAEVEKLIANTPDKIMFNFFNGSLSVLDGARKSILGTYAAKSSEKYAIASTSVLQELLDQGGEEITYFERRNENMTITNGATTLEEMTWCPPICG